MSTVERSDAQDVLGWTAVGVVGLGATAFLFQQVLEIGPQQCLLRSSLGFPCPLCGMSTVTRRVLHGDVLGAMRLDTIGVAFLALVGALALLQLARTAGLTQRTAPVRSAAIAGVALLAGHWVATLTGMVELVPLA